MSCSGFIYPLDLDCIFVNTFAGSPLIFMFISYIAIAALSAFFKFSGAVLLGLILLFTLIVNATGIVNVDYLVILLLIPVSWIIYSSLSKVFKN